MVGDGFLAELESGFDLSLADVEGGEFREQHGRVGVLFQGLVVGFNRLFNLILADIMLRQQIVVIGIILPQGFLGRGAAGLFDSRGSEELSRDAQAVKASRAHSTKHTDFMGITLILIQEEPKTL